MGLAAALALLASVMGAFVTADSVDDVDLAAVQSLTDGSSEAGGDHPAQWDERVEHLVSFVEEERGLEFQHPVRIDFLTPEAFADELQSAQEDLTDEELQEIQDILPMLRALGLLEGDFNLVDTLTEVSQASTLAFYHYEEKRIVAPTTDPTVTDEVVLVHELTHALQDQHFDLSSMYPTDEEDGEDTSTDAEDEPGSSETGIDALVEGDAMRVQDAYLATLSLSDQEDYANSQLGDVDDVEGLVQDIPSTLLALTQAPYSLGPGFVGMIAAEGGNEAVDRAFRDPPTSTTQLMDPRRYIDGEDIAALDPPAVPGGVGEPVEEGDFGALDAYFMLAERLDPLDALTVIDQWGNDSYVVYENADQVCFRIAVESPTASGLDSLRSSFQEWAAAAPPAAEAEVLDAAGGGVLIHTCDPGPDAPLPNDRALDSLVFASMRSTVASEFMASQRELGADAAWGVADCYTRGVYDLVSQDPDLQPEELDQAQLVDVLRDCGA